MSFPSIPRLLALAKVLRLGFDALKDFEYHPDAGDTAPHDFVYGNGSEMSAYMRMLCSMMAARDKAVKHDDVGKAMEIYGVARYRAYLMDSHVPQNRTDDDHQP